MPRGTIKECGSCGGGIDYDNGVMNGMYNTKKEHNNKSLLRNLIVEVFIIENMFD